MAITEDTETYECVQCGDQFPGPQAVAGSFCSLACHDRHRREKRVAEVMRLIEHDHRYCLTCFRQLKEIERPTDEQLRSIDGLHSAESLIGLEYPTEHADHGTKTDPSLFADGVQPGPHESRRRVREGVICECGATDTGDVSEAVRESLDAGAVALRLVQVIEALHDDGKHDVYYAGDTLVGALDAGLTVRDALAEAVILDD